MGPKPTPSKQQTLFSFFSKSPAIVNSEPSKSDAQDVLSPKRSPNQLNKSNPPANSKACDYGVGDLLWCKLEGYPWWPSLVCNHPTDNTHYKGGKQPQIHVQFFDNPVSRAWIKMKNVRPYKGSDDADFQVGGSLYSSSPPVQEGAVEADKALKLPIEDRLKLVVDLQPSDEEEDMDDLDPDIFDGEMSEEDNSKENLAVDKEKKTPKKTPSKSPGKGKRPRRSTAKRRRIIEQESDNSGGDDSADEFKPHEDEGSGNNDDDDDDVSSGVDENDVTSDSASEPNSPIKLPQKRKRPAPKSSRGPKTARRPVQSGPTTPKPVQNSLNSLAKDTEDTSPKVSEATKSKLAAFTAADSVGASVDGDDSRNFQHLNYDWLKPDKIRDKEKRLKSDPDYDPRTLYIPDQEKCKFTPAMRQWWEIKSQHFDTVLFFKMGKFYELFHMDAAIGVNELGLIYMKGDYAHSGFPEIAYGRYADTLVQKGYKVARIEQTETPEMMEKRCKNLPKTPSKFDKVVKREVCRITTKGTKTFSFLTGECADSSNSYLLALAEKESSAEGCSTYGVCFVDTSIGKFHVGQFVDDRHCSRLRTLIAHYPPVQILQEKGHLSSNTQQMINSNLTSIIKEYLSPRTEFWDSSKTLKVLAEENYFRDGDDLQWPEVLKKMMSDTDTLGMTASEDYSLAVSALGALTWYLQYSLLDEELLSMRHFELYQPLDTQATEKNKTKASLDFTNKHMVLDGVTLSNLDITENSSTGSLEGTLLERLDQCSTPFGKRLFRQWLCAPLCNPSSINDRLDAVEDLIGCQDVVAEVTEMLKKLPDLERLLSRIHTLGTVKSSRHPDARAIMYEDVTYSKRKIEDFLATLNGFKVSTNIAKKFKNVARKFKSKLLRRTVTVKGKDNEGYFPCLDEDLSYFEYLERHGIMREEYTLRKLAFLDLQKHMNAFDHNRAKKDGVIVPSKGVDDDYDTAISDIKSTETALCSYLDRQKSRLGCRSIVFWGTGKNRYQMEIPESISKKVPDEYNLMSSKKGWKRYRTDEIEALLSQMTDAEDRKDAALRDVMRRIFYTFDERYKKWDTTVQCLSVLDVLLSLSQYSRCGDGPVCRPEIVLPDADNKPFIEIREARHPCICRTFSGGDFIPNDTLIGIPDQNDMETEEAGGEDSKVVLVTGPNMGGKSTLMRQVGLVAVMAQMGCYVPAEKCRMTPIDRVFTRLGASDRIMAGESTFFVELSETSAILQHATQHSLVLVDELGRGTATYDGTAIACSVVQELSRNKQCRTLFSTHYHSLVEEFSHDPNIRLGHMACMVENEDEEDPTQETITFLYKFTKGACPKSYGFNAARLANLPDEVIRVAVQKAKEFEESQDRLRHLNSLWKPTSMDKVVNLQEQIKMS